MASRTVPEHLIYPQPPFAEAFAACVQRGKHHLAESDVVFVGLARNCGAHLYRNLWRLEELSRACKSWRLHIETNDNSDDTADVLEMFCGAHREASYADRTLGREQYNTEFAGRRTEALAEYRTACQAWVRRHAAASRYVVVIDFDAWGGWSHAGVLHGVSSLNETPDAYGMASVSLLEHPQTAMNQDRQAVIVNGWLHYDAWAYRLNDYWDDYTAGVGGWKHQHVPAVGSRPFAVCSAFGGMAIYKTEAYLQGRYDGTDCEHVPFHRSIAEATGQRLYLDPAMRTVMRWLESDDAAR